MSRLRRWWLNLIDPYRLDDDPHRGAIVPTLYIADRIRQRLRALARVPIVYRFDTGREIEAATYDPRRLLIVVPEIDTLPAIDGMLSFGPIVARKHLFVNTGAFDAKGRLIFEFVRTDPAGYRR